MNPDHKARFTNLKRAFAEHNIPWPDDAVLKADLGPYTETPENKALLEQIKRDTRLPCSRCGRRFGDHQLNVHRALLLCDDCLDGEWQELSSQQGGGDHG
jgi:hypothetical protein